MDWSAKLRGNLARARIDTAPGPVRTNKEGNGWTAKIARSQVGKTFPANLTDHLSLRSGWVPHELALGIQYRDAAWQSTLDLDGDYFREMPWL
jgi:hypothetical protein